MGHQYACHTLHHALVSGSLTPFCFLGGVRPLPSSPHTGDAAASAITARWKTWHVGSHQFLATILMIWEMLQQTKAETFYYYYSSYTTTESVTLCER